MSVVYDGFCCGRTQSMVTQCAKCGREFGPPKPKDIQEFDVRPLWYDIDMVDDPPN